MPYVISFTTDRFDPTREEANPINPIAGQSALNWLRTQLTGNGWRVSEPAAEDWGWYVDVERDGVVYLLGASADAHDASPPIEWTLQVHKQRSLTDRLLGRNTLAPGDRLCELVERLVRADPALLQVEATFER